MSEAQSKDETLLKSVAELREDFDNKDRVILFAGGDSDAFLAFTETFDETSPLRDWTKSFKAADDKTTYAVVQAETGESRMIAVASPELAFQSPAVRDWLYNKLVMHTINRAKAGDATPDMFETVDGAVGRHTMDFTAFKFQAMAIVKKLREMGLKTLTVPGLRMALSNAPFAVSQFGEKMGAKWLDVMALMEQNASERNLDTSIYTYWRAVRDNAAGVPKDFDIDLSGLEDAITDADEAKAS